MTTANAVALGIVLGSVYLIVACWTSALTVQCWWSSNKTFYLRAAVFSGVCWPISWIVVAVEATVQDIRSHLAQPK